MAVDDTNVLSAHVERRELLEADDGRRAASSAAAELRNVQGSDLGAVRVALGGERRLALACTCVRTPPERGKRSALSQVGQNSL